MTEILLTDEAILEDVGARLARRRIDAGLTQIALARQAGVSRSTVDRMERGQTTQMSSFIRILRVLDLLSALIESIPETGAGQWIY